MKLIAALTTLLFVGQAQALVADKFKCELKVYDAKNNLALETEHVGYATRLSMSASPGPDVRLTSGEFIGNATVTKINTKIDFAINYTHGIQINQSGQLAKAAQKTCLTLNYCKSKPSAPTNPVPNPGPIEIPNEPDCMSAMCFFGNDPFNPAEPWQPVNISSAGVPEFDSRQLGSVTAQGSGFKANVVCSHIGTTF